MLLLNLILPGAGVILLGRLLSGALCLLLAMLCLALLALSHVVAVDVFADQLLWLGLAGYGLLNLLSSGWLWWRRRKPGWDARQLRQLHSRCSRAYLCGDLNQAVDTARQLCRLAGELVGSWQLLAMIADAQGDQRLAGRARQRAEAIQNDEL